MMAPLYTEDRDRGRRRDPHSDEAQGADRQAPFRIDWQDPEGHDLSLTPSA